MELIYRVLFGCPKCVRQVGKLLAGVCGPLLLVGCRILFRAERVEERSAGGIDINWILDSLPWPIPSTPGGLALALVGLLLGISLAWVGSWAERSFKV